MANISLVQLPQTEENITTLSPEKLVQYLYSTDDPLMKQPVETRLTDEQYAQGINNGLNFGSPIIAGYQKAKGIPIPQTDEERAAAQVGKFVPKPNVSGGTSKGPNYLKEFLSGYADNYENGINPKNFQNDPDKTFVNRLGEGVGTAMRFIDSPLGRGLLAGGLNSMLGYKNSLQEGLTAMGGRQNAVTADKLYRNQLKQYGYTDDDLSQINGNITSDVYKNLSTNLYRNKQLNLRQELAMAKDNTQRANILQRYWANGADPAMIAAESSRYGFNFGNKLGESNQTKNTNSQINYRNARLKQIDTQLALIDKRINQVSANSAERNALTKMANDLQKTKFEYKQQQDAKNQKYLDAKTQYLILNNERLLNDLNHNGSNNPKTNQGGKVF